MRARKLDFVKSAVREGYEVQGKSMQALAKVYQCSVGTIARCLKEQGVTIKRPGRPTKASKENNNGVSSVQPNTV
jgi:transposase